MSNTRAQELIALAAQAVAQPDAPKPRPKWPIAAGAAVLVLVLGGVGFALTRDDTDTPAGDAGATETTIQQDGSSPATTIVADSAAPATTTAPATTVPDTTVPDTVAPTTVPETTVPVTTVDPAVTTPPTTVLAAAPPDTVAADAPPVRWAEFSGGKVYLAGTVPDQATADEVRDKAGAVVGIDNVIVNYAIVAGAPRPPSAPLYVRDSVLFAKNSVDINDASRGVLDLGVVLMSQNPQITIDIKGHTDSDGSDATNQQLSQRRVDVIFDYLVSQGVDPSRLTKAAFGESQPIADNATSAGRAQNRRVEFQINNLLG